MPLEAPIYPFDWHTPSTTFSDRSPHWWPQQWDPFGSWKVWNGTLLPERHCLCCWDWFNRQRQLTGGVSPTHYSPHSLWHSTQTPPLIRRHTLTKQPSPCPPLPQYKSDFSREHTALLDYTQPSQKEYSLSSERHKAPRTTAAWGAACHVSPSTTSDSPAKVSYAETGKNSTTCFRYSYCTCVSVIALHMSCPWLPFVIFDSTFQLEGILGISLGLSSGVK